MKRYTINNRQYVVHNETLYRVEGHSNHPIHAGSSSYDAVIYTGKIGEFDCHEGSCVFIPHDDSITELVEKEPLGETIEKLQEVNRVNKRQVVEA